MPRSRTAYRCSACGWQTAAYVGRCGECEEWNTVVQVLDEQRRAPGSHTRHVASVETIPLPDVVDDAGVRTPTDIPELDRVLGGGIVPGALVLVGGEPGIGKSTLMLQAAARLASRSARVAYICGEESPRQVRLRASRLGIDGVNIHLVPETNLDAALQTAREIDAAIVFVDSIQSVYADGVETRAGGPAQLAEVGARLVAFAKGTDIPTFVTGHVTKGGDIAGPRLLEHMVDAVIYFENAEDGALRVLRAVKNRFGATDEVGVFEMGSRGLESVENPSAAFLASVDRTASGCAATAVVEGSRPLVVEVQALAVPSFLAAPRRIASGIEPARLHLLLAVLARRGGLHAANLDVVATVSGGLRLRDPGVDLAIAMALASAIKDAPLDPATAYLGEVALSGALRPPHQAARRLAELARLGFTRVLAPAIPGAPAGIEVVPVGALREALRSVGTAAPANQV